MFKIVVLLAGISLASALPAQVEPNAGQWKTWLIASGGASRLPPPDSHLTATELQWIKYYIANRDQAALKQIHYWDAGSPAYRWMQLATQYVVSKNLPAPLATRALALVSAAIYDATIAAWDSKYAYMRQHPSQVDATIQPVVSLPQSPSYPSEHAATAGAAAAVLSYLFPDQADAIHTLADQAGQSRVLAGAAFPTDVFAGLDLGQSVGQAAITYAKGDGSDQVFTGSFPPAPALWSDPKPQTPLAGNWHPWVLTSGQQFRVPAPPPLGSADETAQYAGVKNLTRTNATNHNAWFWQPGFFQPWIQTVEQEIFENHLDTNAPRAARVYALETIAQHDSTIACFDSKYAYLERRPSMADPTITTLFSNPPNPGYPSAHACASGGSAAVMSYLFPADAQHFTSMATEAGTSTFDAGIHTQLDVSTGLTLGGQVGQKVVARATADGAN